MIVSHKYRFVYMPPGKTGTQSISTALKKIGAETFVWGIEGCTTWEYQEPFDGEYIKTEKHKCHFPEELEGYYVFASVRNPYARQISRYLHGKRNGQTPPSQEGFEAFNCRPNTRTRSCYRLLHLNDDYVPPKGCIPFKIDHFIKTETAAEDFHKLPFVTQKINFPHTNKCWFPDTKLHFTPKMAKYLWSTSEDFEFFNYNKQFDITLL